jgi:hypothetical protein
MGGEGLDALNFTRRQGTLVPVDAKLSAPLRSLSISPLLPPPGGPREPSRRPSSSFVLPPTHPHMLLSPVQ